mgnify:FL=1
MSADPESVLTQIRKGVLEYCVLALLRSGPAYGLELATRLGSRQVLLGNEGTLYPLLSRLRRQELVETNWQESDSGPPRRYYQLTAAGHEALETFTGVWAPFVADIESVLKEESA